MLHGKRDFAAIITDLKIGRLSWLIGWAENLITGTLKSGELPPPGSRTEEGSQRDSKREEESSLTLLV